MPLCTWQVSFQDEEDFSEAMETKLLGQKVAEGFSPSQKKTNKQKTEEKQNESEPQLDGMLLTSHILTDLSSSLRDG